MEAISQSDILARIARDNPWWKADVAPQEAKLPKRIYFETFAKLALNFDVRRATILLGPRRVGKTVMVRQLVQAAIDQGVDRECILYISVDAPIYLGMPLEKFLDYNNRTALEVTDMERARRALKGAEGKRLVYKGPYQTA